MFLNGMEILEFTFKKIKIKYIYLYMYAAHMQSKSYQIG